MDVFVLVSFKYSKPWPIDIEIFNKKCIRIHTNVDKISSKVSKVYRLIGHTYEAEFTVSKINTSLIQA